MARPSRLGKPPQKAHQRLTLLLDREDSTKEQISKEEFKEMIKTDLDRVFTMVETLINECEDTIKKLNNVITTQEERLAEQILEIENTAEDKQDAFTLRLARNTGPLVSVATSLRPSESLTSPVAVKAPLGSTSQPICAKVL
ncbi:hypothetical protein BDV29DRAFT_168167 [Aspergillus leporis]|uniref:Uncharacterized protein n=1 Tax=Aspergillus leporis TaxID=41062 RepID=A0A5N5X9X7_9EURO|nr:hypothetical protein BDV29DRAFT_168167 [Aspergillus leporis]